MLKLKDFEKIFPKKPPLAGRYLAFVCKQCGRNFSVDERVFRLGPLVSFIPNRCPFCGNCEVKIIGFIVK